MLGSTGFWVRVRVSGTETRVGFGSQNLATQSAGTGPGLGRQNDGTRRVGPKRVAGTDIWNPIGAL